MKQKNQSGFTYVGLIILIVLVLGVIGGGGYYVWHKNHEQKKSASSSQIDKKPAKVTNYAECLKADGSIVQDLYPATCVTKDKQRFSRPIEQKYLTIKEWGVRIQLSSEVYDAAYTYSKGGTAEAWDKVSDVKLYKGSLGTDCLTGIIIQYKPTSEVEYAGSKITAQEAYAKPSLDLRIKKVGAYYYGSERFIGNCDATKDVQVKSEASMQAFLNAYDSLETAP